MTDPDLWTELDLDRWTWEVPRDTSGPYVAEHIPKPLITDWVKKWKPIINEALEKAEKWDLADKIGPPPSGDARIQWHIDMSNLKIKLEAINTHMTKWVSGHSDWQMGRMSQWKKELVQILGETQA